MIELYSVLATLVCVILGVITLKSSAEIRQLNYMNLGLKAARDRELKMRRKYQRYAERAAWDRDALSGVLAMKQIAVYFAYFDCGHGRQITVLPNGSFSIPKVGDSLPCYSCDGETREIKKVVLLGGYDGSNDLSPLLGGVHGLRKSRNN